MSDQQNVGVTNFAPTDFLTQGDKVLGRIVAFEEPADVSGLFEFRKAQQAVPAG